MKPTVILSSDLSPDYLFCLPIVAKSWELQGWEWFITLCCGRWDNAWFVKYFTEGRGMIYNIEDKYECENNPALMCQCIRLYCGEIFNGNKNRYLLLSDADMFIGSNFLYRDFDKVNVFGHDLTGRDHIPICYTGMAADKWHSVIWRDGFGGLDYDLDQFADLTTKVTAWVADQSILTGKLKAYGYDKINFIDRGIDPSNHNLPLGRWDRYGGFIRPAGVIHDVHLPRKPYSNEWWPRIVEMCNGLYPAVDWGWLSQYRDEFVKEFKLNV